MSVARDAGGGGIQPAEYVTLHGRASSLVIEVSGAEAPLWRYWGPRLPDASSPGPGLRSTRHVPPSSLEFDQPLTIFPTFGAGWFGRSALHAHRDGQAFAQAFGQCDQLPGEPRRATFRLLDDVARLSVTVDIALDDHDVLTMSTVLRNEGDAVLDVGWLAAGVLPLPGACDTVHSFYGQWSAEFQPQAEPLTRSTWERQNRRGRTSHDTFPGASVTTPGATFDTGLVYGAHLGWSGNHEQFIEWLHDGGYQWQFGEWLAPGEARLAPGETLASPPLHASCSVEGRNGLARNFHAALRRLLPWPGGTMRPRPVHLNTWEAVYFDHRLDDLTDLADAAAAIGVERFVLDDGWFHGRHHDRAALGDWWPDEGKYPHGLAPLADHVRARGMEFGLWVEPEMVNPDSDLFRAHPDWTLQIAGRPLLTGRNQLVLDISRPEVAQYLFDCLDALLRATSIAYLKWDMNRDLTTAGVGSGAAGYRKQVLALYALIDRVRAAHPAVEIESCSSGGARIDFGVLRHTHRVWTSDCNDALSRVAIQRGALQFISPEVMGAHVGPAPAHTTGRSQPLAFRAAVALPGHLGVEADVRRLDESERAELAAWIALYKSLRDRLHGGRVWQGEAGDSIVWQAHGEAHGEARGEARVEPSASVSDPAAGPADEVLLFVYRLQPPTFRYPPAIRLPMLRRDCAYRVERLDPLPPAADTGIHRPNTTPLDDALRDGGATLDGAWLAAAGLPLPRMPAESAIILRLNAQP